MQLGLLVLNDFVVRMEQRDSKALLGQWGLRAHRGPRAQVVPTAKAVKMVQVPIKWL